MQPRLNPFAAAPAPMQAWLDFGKHILASGLEPSLMELVKIRASQINGCALCLHMHTTEARKQGETEERIYLLDAWRESPLYSERERAALAWTEALTLVAETRAPDDVYQALQAQFTEEEQVTLTLLIVAINGWNRVQVGFRGVHHGVFSPSQEVQNRHPDWDVRCSRGNNLAYRAPFQRFTHVERRLSLPRHIAHAAMDVTVYGHPRITDPNLPDPWRWHLGLD
jgi:AhpD family alkylhydroperoxidase